MGRGGLAVPKVATLSYDRSAKLRRLPPLKPSNAEVPRPIASRGMERFTWWASVSTRCERPFSTHCGRAYVRADLRTMALVARLNPGETLGDRVMKVDHAGEHGAVCMEMLPELDHFLAHERGQRGSRTSAFPTIPDIGPASVSTLEGARSGLGTHQFNGIDLDRRSSSQANWPPELNEDHSTWSARSNRKGAAG